MNKDINVKKVRINNFRQSKVPGEFMIQLRVPENLIDAQYLEVIQHIAKTWGRRYVPHWNTSNFKCNWY